MNLLSRALLVSVTLLTSLAPADASAAPTRTPDETRVIGYSVKKRPIVASRYGSGAKVIVAVGSVHGNEKSGLPIVRDIAYTQVPVGYTLWVIASANPDGTASSRRQNARGVDINRNFPSQWKRLSCPSKYCSGPSAVSEPETLALMSFFQSIDPTLVVFYHSKGNIVDRAIEGTASPQALTAYGKKARVAVSTVPCGSGPCTGNATQYVRELHTGSTPFVVELPCYNTYCLSSATRARHVAAFWAAAAAA